MIEIMIVIGLWTIELLYKYSYHYNTILHCVIHINTVYE